MARIKSRKNWSMSTESWSGFTASSGFVAISVCVASRKESSRPQPTQSTLTLLHRTVWNKISRSQLPAMSGGRHHLHSDRRGVAVSGRDQGPMHRRTRRPSDVRADDAGSGWKSSLSGRGQKKTKGRPDSSFRSRESVLFPSVPKTDEAVQDASVNEPQGQLLR